MNEAVGPGAHSVKAPYWYERLAPQDRSFLLFERENTHMHLGGITLFEHAPLAGPHGGVDIDRIRDYIGSRLHYIPRYRQRLAWVPVEGYPVWVDDHKLNLHYHVRHASVPRPGDDRQLKSLAARIMSAPLDRRRPLWEAWVIEGLEGNRFAMLLKTHHCVVDGVSGVDLMSVLLRPECSGEFEPAPTWRARPAPSKAELLRDEVQRRVAGPGQALAYARQVWSDPRQAVQGLIDNVAGSLGVISDGLRLPDETPLNRAIGPYRRFDWQSISLAEAKRVKNRLGGTVNDVVLATVSGALRRFLLRRGCEVEAMRFRTVVPVNTRSSSRAGGNHVSAWLVQLPIGTADPRERYRLVSEATAGLKRSKQAEAIETLSQIAEMSDPILTLGVRLAARIAPYNLIVTNVPGPQFPLHLLGSRLVAGYPTVPLFEYQALGIAIFSYEEQLFFGLNADWELLPDLHDLTEDLHVAFRELHEAAVRPAQARRTPRLQARARAAN